MAGVAPGAIVEISVPTSGGAWVPIPVMEATGGAFSDVYRCTDYPGVKGDVAVIVQGRRKKVPEEAKKVQEMLLEELRFARLPETFAVDVSSQGHTLFVQRWYSGGTLDERKGKIPANLQRRLLSQLALALEWVHDCGVLHRDIKTDNVVFDDKGNAVLMDFSLSTLEADSKVIRCGHRYWMAPEMQRRALVYTKAMDVFCLGLTIWVGIRGRRPTYSKQVSEGQLHRISDLAHQTCHREGFEVSLAVSDLLRRTTVFSPTSRIQNGRQLIGETRFSEAHSNFIAAVNEDGEAGFAPIGTRVRDVSDAPCVVFEHATGFKIRHIRDGIEVWYSPSRLESYADAKELTGSVYENTLRLREVVADNLLAEEPEGVETPTIYELGEYVGGCCGRWKTLQPYRSPLFFLGLHDESIEIAVSPRGYNINGTTYRSIKALLSGSGAVTDES